LFIRHIVIALRPVASDFWRILFQMESAIVVYGRKQFIMMTSPSLVQA
jgi:hypothetical protein